MRHAFLLILPLTMLGCGSNGSPSGPTAPDARNSAFLGDEEEFEYLGTLANPTVEQFRRRKALESKLASEHFDHETRARKEAYRAAATSVMKEAKEAMTGIGLMVPNAVVRLLKVVVEDYPGTPEADEAAKLLPEWEAK